jgi:hypothetical protein
MIHGHCRTNLDDVRHKWPVVFAAVPNIGDRVKAVEIIGDSRCSVLKVHSITHYIGRKSNDNGGWDYIPCIEVELNK